MHAIDNLKEETAMRSQREFLNEYAKTHMNPVNQWIHMICVPAILFASLGLLWGVPVGRWLGLAPDTAAWVNLATITGPLFGLFYLRLSVLSFVQMMLIFALCIVAFVAMQNAGWPLLWICGAIWVAAWAVQFYGHEVEGAKPSFLDDLVFLLIGPLFVIEKLGKLARGQSLQVHAR